MNAHRDLFQLSTRVVRGNCIAEALPPLIAADERVLLVSSAGWTRRGMTRDIKTALSPRQLIIHDEVHPNPDLNDLERVADSLRKGTPDRIVAVGGGSVLDSAKALALALPATIPHPLRAVLTEGRSADWDCREVIAVPTTSGTGAEVTPFATIWDHANSRKLSLADGRISPRTALLVPSLTLSLSPDQTLYSGLDVISHALESIWNRRRNPISLALADGALKLATRALPRVLDHPDDLDARTTMQDASLMAGMAIAQTRTAIAHAISYPLTLTHGIPHGLACSFTLPAIMDQITERGVWDQVAAPELRRRMEAATKLLRRWDLHGLIHRMAPDLDFSSLAAAVGNLERSANFLLPDPDMALIIRKAADG